MSQLTLLRFCGDFFFGVGWVGGGSNRQCTISSLTDDTTTSDDLEMAVNVAAGCHLPKMRTC